MQNSLPQRKSLFWDTNPDLIDVEKHAQYIIERVLDYGTVDEVRWLFSQYPKKQIQTVITRPRSSLHQKSRALWELVVQ